MLLPALSETSEICDWCESHYTTETETLGDRGWQVPSLQAAQPSHSKQQDQAVAVLVASEDISQLLSVLNNVHRHFMPPPRPQPPANTPSPNTQAKEGAYSYHA